MFYYKNVSSSEKTFHGVSFQPGEIKQVKKYINNKWMVLIEKEAFENRYKQQKHSSEKSKNPVPEQKPVGKEEGKVEGKEVPKVEGKDAQKEVPKKEEKKEEQKSELKEEQPKQEEKKDIKPESTGQKS